MNDEPTRTRPAADIVQEMNHGQDMREWSREIQALVAAVRDTGKKGSVTLKLTISPSKVNGGQEVSSIITTAMPKFDRSAALFFADGEGNLTRTDPRQLELFEAEAGSNVRRLDTDRPQEAGEQQ